MNKALAFLAAIIIVGLDQVTKQVIRSILSPGQDLFQVGFFHLTNIRNTGAAFGILPTQSPSLTIVSIIGMIVLSLLIVYSHKTEYLRGRLALWALGLVLGGTVGNMIDRLVFGYVTDFLDFTYWPAFNVADASISIGIVLFLLSFIMSSRTSRQSG